MTVQLGNAFITILAFAVGALSMTAICVSNRNDEVKSARREAYRRGVLETRIAYGSQISQVVFPEDLDGKVDPD